MTNHDISWYVIIYHEILSWKSKTSYMSLKPAVRAFLSQKFMITRSSIVFEDLLASSIAPQVMPPLCYSRGIVRFKGTIEWMKASQIISLLRPIISSQDSEGVVRNVHKIALEMLQRWLQGQFYTHRDMGRGFPRGKMHYFRHCPNEGGGPCRNF